jgi:hypothetical protein
MHDSWAGVCPSDAMVCTLTCGSIREVRRRWQAQKVLIFTRFHEMLFGNQQAMWSKQHNGKVRYLGTNAVSSSEEDHSRGIDHERREEI